MQKVVGSSPISRLKKPCNRGVFSLLRHDGPSAEPGYWSPSGPPLDNNFGGASEHESRCGFLGRLEPTTFCTRQTLLGPALRTSLRAGLYKAGLVRKDYGLDAVAQIELRENPCDMRLRGCWAEEQLRSDLGVRQTSCDELHHVELPRR
jgi:hypothetical protein